MKLVTSRNEANMKLASLGYAPVFRGLTSRGGAFVTFQDTWAVANQVMSVSGALVWFGVDQKGRALYYLQMVGEG